MGGSEVYGDERPFHVGADVSLGPARTHSPHVYPGTGQRALSLVPPAPKMGASALYTDPTCSMTRSHRHSPNDGLCLWFQAMEPACSMTRSHRHSPNEGLYLWFQAMEPACSMIRSHFRSCSGGLSFIHGPYL